MNSIIYNEKLTVIIVTFYSSHIIENLINARVVLLTTFESCVNVFPISSISSKP